MTLLSKTLFCLLLCLIAISTGQSTDSNADRILGRWLFPKKQTCVEIYRENGLYFGRMAQISGSCQASYGNISNKVVLTNLSYTDNSWSGGTMIHPSSGMKFSVEMHMSNPNTLVATVYKGMKMFSKELVLTRQQPTS
ncbi:DUF2147 domain-containing protein [Fibrella aquatilis]|uniref:DUF2147 domain-containing protein n=1 Tax=Fibrella aquatilis TaxID=2817059 RepID=A0A939G9L1_9BACT|nr:DUF2147 domain-containing protein [Fibrella aquatilis]MBO0933748.1 DUF2147 domain-containing protein [Fibrella aquatilis]